MGGSMYTKQEVSKQKQAFWTAFGRYMKPVLSADGEQIGWINYKTGNKYVSFRMDVDSRRAILSVVLDHPDPGARQVYFDRFVQLKDILYDPLGEEDWVWQAIISFLKPRIKALDAFWSMVRYQFSNLG